MYSPAEQYRLLDVARAADQLGADFVDVTDHVLMGLATLHTQGWELQHLDQPQPDPLVTLAAMASATQRINGLLSGIVIASLRPGGLLAKMGASLHALSRGRFVMGVTASWQQAEYDALGVPFERRGQVLDDNIGACRALWEAAPASFHSPTVNFDDMFCSPRPAPGERIPVWFGGKFTPRQIRRIVTLGDGWMLYGGLHMSLAEKREAIGRLRERFAAAGRDPASLDICDGVSEVGGSIELSMAEIPAMAAAGVNVFRDPPAPRSAAHADEDSCPVLEESRPPASSRTARFTRLRQAARNATAGFGRRRPAVKTARARIRIAGPSVPRSAPRPRSGLQIQDELEEHPEDDERQQPTVEQPRPGLERPRLVQPLTLQPQPDPDRRDDQPPRVRPRLPQSKRILDRQNQPHGRDHTARHRQPRRSARPEDKGREQSQPRQKDQHRPPEVPQVKPERLLQEENDPQPDQHNPHYRRRLVARW